MYQNRDLSWLEFNYRVLQEAANPDVPLFDRIKFLSIFSSNLDEFFSIRYPVVLAIANLKPKKQKKIDNELSDDFLQKIQAEIERQYYEFGNILTRQIIPELEANDIILYYNRTLREEHIPEVREIFFSRVLSFLQPIFLNPSISDKFEPEANKLYLIVSLIKNDGGIVDHAIIRIPSDNLKRFYSLSQIDGRNYVVFIDDIIRENCSFIFPGFKVVGVYSIKFNRNEDLDFEEDYRGDILKLIEKKLVRRAHGLPSRLLFESAMPRNIQLYVASVFKINFEELFVGGRYHNMADLCSLPGFGKKLVYDEWKQLFLLSPMDNGDIFKEIEKSDLLLHFPYHSYNPVLSFFNQAAIDPAVTEIYITLYRLAADSLIANALISAAKNGKKVTVFIELKARFDEANNIAWSRKMKKAGVEIIYSIPGIKVHTKIALVIKDSRDKKKTYSIISTGNFNEQTARYYTDHTLFTTDKAINGELHELFNFLKKREKPPGTGRPIFAKLLVSQFNMKTSFETLINAEMQKARTYGTGLIRIKVNNLEEPGMIDMLYKASKAGVTIRLIVRSICCLIPAVKEQSENIRVKRLVDRYLEHTRLFIFGNHDDSSVYIGSSDWMTRNIYHRIEVCTMVIAPGCKQELLDYFDMQWNDNNELQITSASMPDEQNEPRNVQRSIYNYLKNKT
jgi:polyphosphate kinase